MDLLGILLVFWFLCMLSIIPVYIGLNIFFNQELADDFYRWAKKYILFKF